MAKRGPKPIQWREDIAHTVRGMAQYGISYEDIACYVGMSLPTLKALYMDELHKGKIAANAKVGERLYRKAMDGDTTALIFWAKTRMGWREVQRVDHTSSDGSMTPKPAASLDLSKFSAEQLTEMAHAAFRDKKNEIYP